MKIAFVNQPWTDAVPSPTGDSVGIWTYNTARQLAISHEIVTYGEKRSVFNKTNQMHEGICYRGSLTKIDRWVLNKIVSKFNQISQRLDLANADCPFIISKHFYLTYILQIARDLAQQNCDLVHIHNFSQFIPIIRAFNPKIKIVLHMHCEWLSQFNYLLLERRLKQADLIIGCSEYITEKIQSRFPFFKDRCKTIYNGVDIGNFSQESKIDLLVRQTNPVRDNPSQLSQETHFREILFVGRISPEKGIHVLLDAFHQVIQSWPHTRLRIIGSEVVAAKEWVFGASNEPESLGLSEFYLGSYLEKLKHRMSADINNRVVFTGYVSHEELPIYYKNATIVVNPSLSEAFGMSLVESMACGIPVIAARVGGMTSIIQQGETGVLVEPNNPSVLAHAICELLSNEDLRKSMGQAGRQRALALFSWSKVAESLEAEYKNICKPYESAISSNSSLFLL
ncbi:glycosyltransferase family 4 protein [Kovacikia minuta CCNUW1]|uniref:glycosyltransferase family 4 protein n=1 Tax=Kovacikia minuta TaxID=2931930 RepID=UPI001CCDCFC3|nr:glycosyltransferase family 4 protein [Kovacikia minuta]UBF27320.1 glycosyltransferase family 4 protein [Kovacikia minuta CCNUW1]